MVEHRRPCDEHRPDDVVGTVNVGGADDFDGITVVARVFRHQCCHVLIDVLGEHGLDKEDVIVAVHRLEDAQIVDISVAVEVQVGHRIRRTVEQLLELLDGGGLREERCNSLEIKMKRNILRLRVHLCDSGCRMCLGRRHGRTVISVVRACRRAVVGSCARLRGVGDDSCREASCAHERQECND